MRLLEDLSSGKYNLFLIAILFIFMFHQYWCTSSVARSTKESMSNVLNDIKEAVKQVYLADVEAIRNLSEVATKLQKEGLIIPGDLTIKGQITCEKKINGLTLSELNTKIDSVNSSHNTNNTNLNNNISSLQRSVDSINSNLNNFVRYSDRIRITNQGTGNHEGGSKKWVGLCGHGDCRMVNVVLTDEPGRVNFVIEKG
jgi:hypothetical protein